MQNNWDKTQGTVRTDKLMQRGSLESRNASRITGSITHFNGVSRLTTGERGLANRQNSPRANGRTSGRRAIYRKPHAALVIKLSAAENISKRAALNDTGECRGRKRPDKFYGGPGSRPGK
mgnify:CR=1 FL=1